MEKINMHIINQGDCMGELGPRKNNEKTHLPPFLVSFVFLIETPNDSLLCTVTGKDQKINER